MHIPAAIIFINFDFNSITQTTLHSQLKLSEIITKTEFDARITADPNYPNYIQFNNLRLLVTLPTLQDTTNRSLADIVLFYKQGLVTVEMNKFGPPGNSYDLQRINIYDLLRSVNSPNVIVLPQTFSKPTKLGGIVVDQLADASGVHDANPDNIYNNPAFINRK